MTRTITLAAAALLLAGGATADVNLCLYNGTSTLHYQCYETELTCEDVTIGLIIRECEDLSIGPGGGGPVGGGVIADLHPDLDGQGLAGPGPGYTTTVGLADGATIVEVVLLFETRDTFSPGRRMQAVGRTAGRALYVAEFDADYLDPDSDDDTVIDSTPGGEPILGALDLEPTGVTATGDATVSVTILDPAAKAVISVHHTPIVFGDLTWTFLSDGPVGNESMSWGGVKALY